MNVGEIITIVVVSVLMVAVIAYLIYKKVKGQSVGCDCGGSCSACGHCNACKSVRDKTAGDSVAKK